MSAILHESPRGLDAESSDPLVAVLQRCLEKDRESRFQLVAEVARELSTLGTRVAQPNESARSIAVLPFADMSAGKELDYLCEGMAEEILNALTKVGGLRVACRTSSFRFKESSDDARQIGAALSVKTLLQGSVRAAPGRLRVTVQLVDCASGFQRWSERYDREMGDVFQVQDDITSRVVEELIGHLAPRAGGEALEQGQRHSNTHAYHLYLKGRYYWHKRHLGETGKALDFFEKAIEANPGYALAYAGLADAHSALGIYGFVPPTVARGAARGYADKALALDETLAEAHRALGFINLYYEWNWTRGEQELRKAIELNPSLVDAHSYYAILLAAQGRYEEAAREAERSVSLDPYSADAHYLYAVTHLFSRDYDAVIAATRRAAELEPSLLVSWVVYALAAFKIGELAAALEAGARFAKMDNALFLGATGKLQADTGHEEAARECLATLERRSAAGEYIPAIFRAWILAALGEADEAIGAIREAVKERHPYLVYSRTDMLDGLQGDPRLEEIVARIGTGSRA